MPALALYALFVLWPSARVCWLALQRWNGYGSHTFIGLANFTALWGDPLFRGSLLHSALWEGGAALIPSVLALGVAMLLIRSRGKPLLLTAFFFPALLPPTVVAAIWVLVYSPIHGLANRALEALGLGMLSRAWLGDPHLALAALFVAWVWSSLGVGVVILFAGMTVIGREYVELAVIEGAGPLWRFRHITLPGLRRVGMVVLLINTALGGQVFDLIFVTTGGGPGYATTIVPLDVYGRAFGGRAGQGAAAASIQLGLGLALAALLLLVLGRRGESLASDEPWIPPSRGLFPTGLLVLLLLILLLPLGWLLSMALLPDTFLGSPPLDPRSWSWSNLAAAWNAGMAGAAITSIALALGAVLGTVLLAWPAAYALDHLVRARALKYGVLALLLFGLLQPTPALIIPLFSLLGALGLLDTPWGVLLPEIARTIPFAVLVLWGFMGQSPREVLEAAEVDGASSLQRMVWIATPLVRPALYAAAVWAFVSSWNEYLLPTLVSQDGSIQTVPTLLATFLGRYDTQYGLLAAGCLMAIAPSLTIYLLLRRPAGSGLVRLERSIQ